MKSLIFLPLVLLTFSAVADVAQNVTIQEPFVRAAIQQQRNSAAFMKIVNSGELAKLVYAKSTVASIVELHTHIHDNGVMRMRKIKQINLPSGQIVTLQPGGLHVMLLGLNRDLKTGEKVDLILGFADGSEKSLQLPVKNTMMHKKPMMGHKKQNGKPMLMTH